ncbi:MAG: AEC family transporter [Alterinioella nitratireducens]|uniref:AEC family transporter n=1 Tax=Alterinioella nitratireducens TaxID=2735915 RepID=UPI0040580A68
MLDLLLIVLPVFLVVGAGYVTVWGGLFSDEGTDALMVFTQKFAIPSLLFRAISTLDLGQNFEWALLVSFYTGSLISFTLGTLGARHVFGRPWTDSVAIGFVCLFANSVLLGLPVMESAFGPGSLGPSYAIVSVHAAFCYFVGITVMETVSARGRSPLRVLITVARAMFRNSLMIGVGLGFVVNLTGLPMPEVATDAIDLMARSALPVALFGLGGVLFRYRPEGDAKVIAFICILSLMLHPAIAYGMGRYVMEISDAQLRGAVVTAAMAPGVNSYIFANMYGVARRVAASAVLIGTALTVLTASFWLYLLP